MRRYKDTFVGQSSALRLALEKSEAEAKKIYDETTKAFFALYGEDAKWFIAQSKESK